MILRTGKKKWGECVQCYNNVNVLQISYQKFVEFWWQILSEVTDDVCFAEK